ncbi:aldo/keto reductase [Sphingomonas sp. AOB5]|uniref:aldo/keto reductase n=1 Tax=Sphingomonas sp. AOB5 TaxID=3034017 RepID=UPI0023F953B6|nr:aldo/keto reductase [Sphingomonas sp. AOB5]MDF7774095.1 aldo/keto reductase [Sphingomonas sp. AOB5]
MIPRRRIGRTELFVPELGFGTAALGNLYRQVSDADAHATVEAALAAGLTYADTAPYYGFGLAERRLGEALHGEVVVSTKVGRLLVPVDGPIADERHGFVAADPFEPVYDYSHDGILRSHEDSLRRLNRDRIDMLLVHDIGARTHGANHPAMLAQLLGSGVTALRRLRNEGTVSAIGIGVNETEIALDLIDRIELDAILLAGRYTLLEQGALDALFPRCAETGTSIVIGGPYNSGLLTGGATYDYAAAPADILERARRLEAACVRHGVSLAAAALQFPLAHPLVASVIPGLASPKEVQETVTRYSTPIPPALWEDLKAQGLLHPHAPIPQAVAA